MTERANQEPLQEQKPQEQPTANPATDPQEQMKGPLSSLMHKTGHSFETNETKEEAMREHQQKW